MSGASSEPLRVLVCDDSALIRGAISRIIEGDPAIRVVARASNGQQAVDTLRQTPVDVVVLDVEMPGMDGLTALPLLLRTKPAPRVLMASALTTRGAEVTLRALRLGAADCIAKPSAIGALGEGEFRRDLVSKIHALGKRAVGTGRSLTLRLLPRPVRPSQLLAVGSSTGGPQSLFSLVQGLGTRVPVPVVMTQHMPASFMPTLAQHLGRIGGMPCLLAEAGQKLLPGHVYLAPGDRHLRVERSDGLRARLDDGPPVNFCRPSVDPLFESASQATAGAVVLTMLTGMGQDGLNGTRAAVDAGAVAVAQDEETSVVWGMPGAIARAGLCHAVLPLPQIAPWLLEQLAR